jgi:hypothetical protein
MKLTAEDLHEIDVAARRYALFKLNCYNADRNDLLGPVKAGILSYDEVYYLGLVECCMGYIRKGDFKKVIYPEDTHDLVSIILGITSEEFSKKHMEIAEKLCVYAGGRKIERQK